MLTFNQLSEKKTKIKINPKQADLKEKIKHSEIDYKRKSDRKDKEEPTVESVEGEELKEYSPNVTYQAKGGKKSGKLGKSSVYSLKDKGESKKEFRKSHTKDIKDGLLKKEEAEYVDEERSARKMNVRTKGTIKKQIAKDAAAEAKRRANKTGEYKEKPKKKVTLKKPSQLTSVKAEPKKEKPVAAVKKVAPKPKAKAKPKAKPVAKKKEAPRTQKGAMAYDGPNKARSQAADRVKAKTKAKQKTLPKKKEAPKKKSGLGDRVRDAVKQGVKRHRKATQGARVFAKGAAKGAKDTVKFAGKVKKVFTGEGVVTYKSFIKEATRLKKEKGYDKGGTKKPSGKKDAALAFVLDKIRKEHGKGAVMTGGSRQQKKVKGAKSTAGTGKYKKAADQKKQTASDAKKRGFKSSKDYVNTIARYGGKDNYDKGKGLGT